MIVLNNYIFVILTNTQNYKQQKNGQSLSHFPVTFWEFSDPNTSLCPYICLMHSIVLLDKSESKLQFDGYNKRRVKLSLLTDMNRVYIFPLKLAVSRIDYMMSNFSWNM